MPQTETSKPIIEQSRLFGTLDRILLFTTNFLIIGPPYFLLIQGREWREGWYILVDRMVEVLGWPQSHQKGCFLLDFPHTNILVQAKFVGCQAKFVGLFSPLTIICRMSGEICRMSGEICRMAGEICRMSGQICRMLGVGW